MSLGDVPQEDLKELATYLKRFSTDDDEEEQFWYRLARTLRKRNSNKFNYSSTFLVTIGQHGDDAAWIFMKDLIKRNLQLEELLPCLEIIKCKEAVNFFNHGATTPIIIKPQDIQPDLRLKVGETLCLSVMAKCDPGPLTYCWFHNRTPIVASDSHKLIINNLTTGHKGTYCCRVTNPSINDSSKACSFSPPTHVEVYENQNNMIIRQETMIIPPAPIIHKHPTSVSVRQEDANNCVTFECSAKEGVIYDWYKDGTLKKKNCSEGKLVLNTVRMEDQGEYYCIVVNDGGTEKSNPAKLTLIGDIEITEQPVSYTIYIIDKLKLKCSAHSRRDRDLNYEWFRVDRGELVCSLAKGKTFCTEVKTNDMTSRRKFKFCCRVADSLDPKNYIESDYATVTVRTVWITSEPCDIQAQIRTRSRLTCTGEGVGTLTYRWFYSPTKEGNYKLVTKSDVLVFDKLSQTNCGYYYCQVSNKWENVNSKTVQVKSYLPQDKQSIPSVVMKITHQPRSLVVPEETDFRMVFKVVCSNREPIQYQWYFRGTSIDGANSSVYIRKSITVDDCGSYWCEAKAGSKCIVGSDIARVDMPFDEEKKEPQNANWEQREAERCLRIKSGDRYALEKVALLIGNQHYQHLRDLNTPESDIKELEAVLKAPPYNFKVFSYTDLTHHEMQAALEIFYDLLHVSGTYALFYFSGHGFKSNVHNNFIVPVDSKAKIAQCFHVDDIAKKVQEKHSRAFMILDACKLIVHEQISDGGSLSSLVNSSNMVEIWSCTDNTKASDGIVPCNGVKSRSSFNKALVDAISTKKTMYEVYQTTLDIIRASSDQRPFYKGAFADGNITLHDLIMNDNPSLDDKLDSNYNKYQRAIGIPEPYIFKEADMNDLNMFAELHLSFSSVLTNVLQVNTELYQLHDKTTSASIEFDQKFLASQGVGSSQVDPHLDGQEEGLCACAQLTVRGLQKLKKPLTLLLTVKLMESGLEKNAVLTYEFDQLPLISEKCV